MTKRDLYICAYIAQGRDYDEAVSAVDTLPLLTAAGEQDIHSDSAQHKIDKLTEDRNALSGDVAALRVIVRDRDLKLTRLEAELARLHRLQEPLTNEERGLAAKEAHGHSLVRDMVALDLTTPNFSVRLFIAMLERSISAVKNRRA